MKLLFFFASEMFTVEVMQSDVYWPYNFLNEETNAEDKNELKLDIKPSPSSKSGLLFSIPIVLKLLWSQSFSQK